MIGHPDVRGKPPLVFGTRSVLLKIIVYPGHHFEARSRAFPELPAQSDTNAHIRNVDNQDYPTGVLLPYISRKPQVQRIPAEPVDRSVGNATSPPAFRMHPALSIATASHSADQVSGCRYSLNTAFRHIFIRRGFRRFFESAVAHSRPAPCFSARRTIPGAFHQTDPSLTVPSPSSCKAPPAASSSSSSRPKSAVVKCSSPVSKPSPASRQNHPDPILRQYLHFPHLPQTRRYHASKQACSG